MKKNKALIDKIIRLSKGESIASSTLNGRFVDDMLDEGVLVTITNGSRKSYRASDEISLRNYLASHYDIRDLESYSTMLENNDVSRAEQVSVTGDSKTRHQRTFRGFLVNCYEPIDMCINGSPTILQPHDGTFMFVYDYVGFKIPNDVIIIGIENAENFRYIRKQKYLFDTIIPQNHRILFVSRYPQEQSHDLMQWLRSIPNEYIHFGDLDLAGVHIFLTEYFNHLGSRSSFLIPHDYEERISQGSKERYITQYPRFGNMKINDNRVKSLVDCIHKYHRGYDQEGYIAINT